MDQTEKLLMGIEHMLSVASDLVQEIDRLKRGEEECQMLKENFKKTNLHHLNKTFLLLLLMAVPLQKCKIFHSKKRAQLRIRGAAFYKN
ncbi:hypothetical protein ACLHWY_25350 [Priestia aryabhattai]|uniref:hypothetical protein n=1 Tax=Priestia aryabhattai TaxID=412384 RepID=UPI003983D0E5